MLFSFAFLYRTYGATSAPRFLKQPQNAVVVRMKRTNEKAPDSESAANKKSAARTHIAVCSEEMVVLSRLTEAEYGYGMSMPCVPATRLQVRCAATRKLAKETAITPLRSLERAACLSFLGQGEMRRANSRVFSMARASVTQAPMRLTETSKKSRPMMTLSQAPGLRTISVAISLVMSSNRTTWSESQRTERVTCSAISSKNGSSAAILSAAFSVGRQ